MAIRLEVIGNLGRDAEVKDINGRQWLSFRVAPSRGRNDGGEAMWVSCLYGGLKLKEWLTKGKCVFVRGRYSDKLYTGNDGRTGIDRQLFVDDLELLGGGGKDGADPFIAGARQLEQGIAAQNGAAVQQPKQQMPPPQTFSLEDDDDGDLPF